MKGIIRKTILGIWFFGGLSACTSKPHFTIEGSLDEKVDGEAYIVGYPAGIKNRIPWRGLKSGTGNLR